MTLGISALTKKVRETTKSVSEFKVLTKRLGSERILCILITNANKQTNPKSLERCQELKDPAANTIPLAWSNEG